MVHRLRNNEPDDSRVSFEKTELYSSGRLQTLGKAISESPEKVLSELSESRIRERFENTDKESIVLEFSQAQELLTEKRRELLQTLSEKEFDSITELSKELGRDKKNVSQDIKKLYQSGVIDLEDQGRSKKPVFEFSKIEIESLEFELNRN